MDMMDAENPSKCLKLLCVSWKFCKCIFSHVTLVSLVVAYCVLGALAFEKLEATHEREVKRSIKFVRGNVTERLWAITQKAEILIKLNWTDQVVTELRDFEKNLLRKMKKDGWDGNEDDKNIQWTFAGALFYSIIVITTIGYGHIAPKTRNGKVVTIFYAILGIPLMLLCLSNIGDVMASSFRFLYWKICCYVCTRPPKPRRARSSTMVRGYSVRQGSGRSGYSRGTSLRRSVRASERSADSALGLSESMTRSTYSDAGYRYHPQRRFNGDVGVNDSSKRATLPSTASPRNLQVASPLRHTYDIAGSSTIPRSTAKSRNQTIAVTQSLDRRYLATRLDIDKTSVFFNKYALEEPELPVDERQSSRTRSYPMTRSSPRRAHSVDPEALTAYEVSRPRKIGSSAPRKPRSNNNSYTPRAHRREAPSPRIMSPMGFAVHRQIYADDVEFDDYSTPAEDPTIKPVPIWLCVFLVVSYILGGAALFNKWEHWMFLDSAYFCFITLTTIGFGDFVPAQKLNAHLGIALCSLYLLFGIALLAMSFNLVQEEVITNVKSVAKRLGIIKEDDSDDGDNADDDDDGDNDDGDIDHDREFIDYVDHPHYDCEFPADYSRQRAYYIDDERNFQVI